MQIFLNKLSQFSNREFAYSQLIKMEKNTAIHVRLESNIRDLIQGIAKEYGLSIADFVRIAIRAELQRLGYLKEGLVSLQPRQAIDSEKGGE